MEYNILQNYLELEFQYVIAITIMTTFLVLSALLHITPYVKVDCFTWHQQGSIFHFRKWQLIGMS